jgi:hypothetical protein
MQRVARPHLDRNIAEDRGQANELDLGTGRGIKDRHRIVDARIRIDNRFHLKPLM